MKIYFSGISGTGIGPLAELAHEAGYTVCGSDLRRGAIADEIDRRGIAVSYGAQDGRFLQKMQDEGAIDRFVYTSSLPEDHQELQLAREWGIPTGKRDSFLAEFIREKGQKLIAVAGTHGKTTTTAMLIWLFRQLGVRASHLVGTTLGWADGGKFDKDAEYFIYEADEYDRNFLAYQPEIAVITCIDYDHPDSYPTVADYRGAFAQFEAQSKKVIKNPPAEGRLTLVGELRKADAELALAVADELGFEHAEAVTALNMFPGAKRRFEEIYPRVFSDYAHHPREIEATINMAEEVVAKTGAKGLAVVYQPHQNRRQQLVLKDYKNVFLGADRIFWLPTFLTREDPTQRVLEPAEFIETLVNYRLAEAAEADAKLTAELRKLQKDGWVILLCSAGPADDWLRKSFATEG